MVTNFEAGETYKNTKTGQAITVFAILSKTETYVLMAGVDVNLTDMSTSRPHRIQVDLKDLNDWEGLSLE